MRWRYLGIAASLLILAMALVALHKLLAEVHLHDVLAQFRRTPLSSVLSSLSCTALSYFALTGYDVMALNHLGKRMPYGRTALASFTSYTFSHNIGLSLVTGGSIRYRIYSVAGLSATEIAALTLICASTFGLGVSLLLGVSLIAEPSVLSVTDTLPPGFNRLLGLTILLVIAGYLAWTTLRRRPLSVRGWSFSPPGPRMTLVQFALGSVDIGLAAGALYMVLPDGIPLSFAGFVGVYVVAMTIGVVSHSPGGLGVFEAVMLLALPDADQGAVLGSLLVYRCIYYLLPLAVAAVLLSWHEFRLRRDTLGPAVRAVRRLAHNVAPSVLGAAVFAGGAILLFSAATPALEGRITELRDFLPEPFIEASHLLSSVVGLFLMIMARWLFRRLDGAFHLTVATLCGGIVFSLLKGFDYEEALILAGVLALLLASRPAFYRKASLLGHSLSAAWFATIAAIIAGSVWLGLFAYKHVEYSSALWWEFAYHGDASRFLRASLTVVVLAVGFLLYTLLRPARLGESRDQPEPATLRGIIAKSERADANLALNGDKRFLVSEAGDAFIMFQVQGRSWITLGDPVGDVSAWEPLLWRFRELCDRHDGWPVFYQVSAENLPLYLDLGLSLFKFGEQARVALESFSLEGPARKDLRYAERRALKEGAEFEVVPAGRVPEIFSELRAVSDEWLRTKATQEKGFSVGSFSEGYLRNFGCAVVRRNSAIVAFANVWRASDGSEVSIDLMRHTKDAPYGVMDFLFLRLMQWAAAEGYSWFDLGMAPLSGLETHPLGPVWHRVGAMVFRHGEHFYNFEGLRAYKEKFLPVWSPKYVAAPGGLVLPRVLLDVATLISGGTRGIVTRKGRRTPPAQASGNQQVAG